MDRRKGYGNCPECHLCVVTRSNGRTPRHSHIKWHGQWLPACSGTGKPAMWVQWREMKPKEKA